MVKQSVQDINLRIYKEINKNYHWGENGAIINHDSDQKGMGAER